MDVVLNQILKTYSVITSHLVKWNEILTSSQESSKKLLKLSEQLNCVEKVQPCTLTTNFPDLQNRLAEIVKTSMDEEKMVLQSLWEDLSLANQKLKVACDSAYQAYLENSTAFEAHPNCFSRTELHTSLASSMEWMREISRFYREQLGTVKHELEMFDYGVEAAAGLAAAWNVRPPPAFVDDILSLMSHLLEVEK